MVDKANKFQINKEYPRIKNRTLEQQNYRDDLAEMLKEKRKFQEKENSILCAITEFNDRFSISTENDEKSTENDEKSTENDEKSIENVKRKKIKLEKFEDEIVKKYYGGKKSEIEKRGYEDSRNILYWVKNLVGFEPSSEKTTLKKGLLLGKKILDIGCGSTNGEYTPRLCRSLKMLGAEPIGIDKGLNQTEEFQTYELDLLYDDFPFFDKESLDGINCRAFLSLSPFDIASGYINKYPIIQKYKINIDNIEFYPGLTYSTSPSLRRRFDYEICSSYLYSCHSIASKIFSLAEFALKDGAILFFDYKTFIKKDGVLKSLDSSGELVMDEISNLNKNIPNIDVYVKS